MPVVIRLLHQELLPGLLILFLLFFFLMIRRPPRSTLDRSSAASDVYKRQLLLMWVVERMDGIQMRRFLLPLVLSLIHISEPTRLLSNSYAVFCLKKKKK